MHALETLNRLNQEAVDMAPMRAAQADARCRYLGHGARSGGLQAHSMGDEYPYIIHGITTGPHAPTEYQVMDSRTGNTSQRFPTYMAAYIHYTSLRVRNLMHS